MFYKFPKYFRMYDSIFLYYSAYSFGFHNPTMMSSLYSKCPGNSITKQNIWHHQLMLSPNTKTNSRSHGAEVQVSVLIMTPPPPPPPPPPPTKKNKNKKKKKTKKPIS